jgi:hypothetical protein
MKWQASHGQNRRAKEKCGKADCRREAQMQFSTRAIIGKMVADCQEEKAKTNGDDRRLQEISF